MGAGWGGEEGAGRGGMGMLPVVVDVVWVSVGFVSWDVGWGIGALEGGCGL